MGTTEWIALGLLIIALIGWLRWGGSPLGSKAFQYATSQRIGRTSEAISTIHNSWKPSQRDASSGLQRLVGDLVYKDHLFIDQMINHPAETLT